MKNMEIAGYDFFVDREKERPCLVAGNAPTIRNFPYKRFQGIYIMMNTGPRVLKGLASPDYWVNANFLFPVPQSDLKEINSFGKSTFIFADSVAYARKNVYNYAFLKDNLTVPWFAFDERHFNHAKCRPEQACCRLADIYPRRITFQEFLEQRFGVDSINRAVGTAVLHSLAFAVLMGSSPIYLQGIELPLYAKDYSYYKASHPSDVFMAMRAAKARVTEMITGKPKPSDFAGNIEGILSDFTRLINICHDRGIEIYNLSRTSTLNRIKELPYKDPDSIK